MLQVALCLIALVAAANCMPSEIEAKAPCGTEFQLTLEQDYRLTAKGNTDRNDTCLFKFTSVVDGNCKGTCHIFDHYSEIKDDKVTLTVGKVIYTTGSDFPEKPMCSDDVMVDVTLSHASGYKFNKTYPSYKFKLNVYNKCGPKGQVVNLNFDEAIKEVDGYHHGEERSSREKSAYLTGILLGFGMAAFFLILLGITYCYTRNSPNRRPSRSAGLPKLAAKTHKMTPGQQPKQVEMGLSYKASDPDRVAVKPLMSSGSETGAKKEDEAEEIVKKINH